MVATAASAPALADTSKTTGTTATESTAALPTVDVSTALTTGVEQSADATQTAALRLELRTNAQEAAEDARKAAAKAKKEAEARAAAEERARERAAARAAEREELAAASASSDAPADDSAPAAETPAAAPAASGSVGTVLDFLNAQVGKAYVLGATGPSSYDCSGLTQAAFRTVGVELPRTAAEQSTVGTPVAVSDVQPGDLVFWGGTGSAYHVAVYIGDGKYLDAANPSKGVVIQEMSYYMPTSAVRVL
ncbi:C40 family peptidase [Streptomyces sp. CMB-StM0423]|uniref:C40 family peptidase n=1 Tax=Streptomyces sp. CMB-StM0423 TaxID=2059884 RepID=UPI000C714CAD|nr:C40 family peptidase [Streptomyces sp. CMB-StM0423]AUH44892.1 glycoside hydrolase [Streptomyces sp. CMB-StM0423]